MISVRHGVEPYSKLIVSDSQDDPGPEGGEGGSRVAAGGTPFGMLRQKDRPIRPDVSRNTTRQRLLFGSLRIRGFMLKR